jgi:transposase
VIAVPSDVRVWLATGYTDMRRGMHGLAERALRGLALGRKAWLFAGSDRGAERAAIMYSLIVTAKLNEIDPLAWLADVLGRIAGHPAQRLDELLPWHWAAERGDRTLAA